MGNIVVPVAKRMAEMEALAQLTEAMQEKQTAVADYIAMMADVDLSAIDDDDTMEGMSDEQDV